MVAPLPPQPVHVPVAVTSPANVAAPPTPSVPPTFTFLWIPIPPAVMMEPVVEVVASEVSWHSKANVFANKHAVTTHFHIIG
jgi:hypothetical protein